MNINDVWNLFKKTGKLEYYLKYNEMKNKGMIYLGDKESSRNSSK